MILIMKKSLLAACLIFALILPALAGAPAFKPVADWHQVPPGLDKLGNQHGDVAISAKGEVYVSILSGPKAGVQVFAPDGKYLRNVPNAPNDFHGFVIHRDNDGTEYIYGPRLNGQTVLKMTLDGQVVLDIPGSAIPEKYKAARKGKKRLRLTACDVAPNGDIFVTDGYASDYVHRFNSKGEYQASFGGRVAPYNFKTLHKIAIDTRFDPPRIIGADRANLRVVHLSLDGKFLGEVAKDMLLPAAVVVHGDYAAIGEIKGRVTLLDKAGKAAAVLGANSHADEVGTNKTEPVKWRPGIVTAPHGVAFSPKGDLYVSEYSLFGRVHKFEYVK